MSLAGKGDSVTYLDAQDCLLWTVVEEEAVTVPQQPAPVTRGGEVLAVSTQTALENLTVIDVVPVVIQMIHQNASVWMVGLVKHVRNHVSMGR